MKYLLVVLALAACPARPNALPELKVGKAVYVDEATDFEVRFNELNPLFAERGEVGEIHPAVLEYILSTEESPLSAYYDLILALPSPPRRAAKDLAALADEAKLLAGAKPVRGRHYARAVARRIAPWINIALGLKFDNDEVNDNNFLGTAGLYWGLAADLDANVLLRRYERPARGVMMRTLIVRHASAGLVVVRSTGTDRLLVWDIGSIRGGFDPKEPLDYDTVAAQIVALHPFTTAPGKDP